MGKSIIFIMLITQVDTARVIMSKYIIKLTLVSFLNEY